MVKVFPSVIERQYIHSVNLSDVRENYEIHLSHLEVRTEFLDYGAGMPNVNRDGHRLIAEARMDNKSLYFLSYPGQEIRVDGVLVKSKNEGESIEIKLAFEPLISYFLKKVSLYD